MPADILTSDQSSSGEAHHQITAAAKGAPGDLVHAQGCCSQQVEEFVAEKRKDELCVGQTRYVSM